MVDFQFRRCDRPFQQPLETHHGIWSIRESIILRLADADGKVGFGEIAPLSWFGSETFAQAWDFCSQLETDIIAETVFTIPDRLPACQFGFETAWEQLHLSRSDRQPPPLTGNQHYAGLLATGTAALDQWQPLYQAGYRTLKWKIGVDAVATEVQIFQQLCQQLPPDIQLRLDPNGGLDLAATHRWLQACESEPVEFLEQPLGVNQFDAMLALAKQYSTPIALDESVATVQHLQACYQQGWPEVFIIKPAIAGYPSKLRQFLKTHQLDIVFSSVFESPIARQAALNLAAEWASNHRALGFGTSHWFAKDDYLEEPDFEALWQGLQGA